MLKQEFAAAAQGFTGSGYLWLVRQGQTDQLDIVPTYGPGSILVHAGQPVKPDGTFSVLGQQPTSSSSSSPSSLTSDSAPTSTEPTESDHYAPGSPFTAAQNPVAASQSPFFEHTLESGFVRSRVMNPLRSNATTNVLEPLLCLSMYEHAYMPDYGLWGKKAYVDNFWKCVNWNGVAQDLKKF